MCGVITIRNYASHSEISHPSWGGGGGEGGGGNSRLMWWTGRRTMGGWVSLFEENTFGALGGAPDTTMITVIDFTFPHYVLSSDVLVGVFHTHRKSKNELGHKNTLLITYCERKTKFRQKNVKNGTFCGT